MPGPSEQDLGKGVVIGQSADTEQQENDARGWARWPADFLITNLISLTWSPVYYPQKKKKSLKFFTMTAV